MFFIYIKILFVIAFSEKGLREFERRLGGRKEIEEGLRGRKRQIEKEKRRD